MLGRTSSPLRLKARGPKNAGGSETLNRHREESSMQAHKLTVTAFSLGAALALGTPAKAADLPQSGTIKIHGTHKGTVQAVQVGEKHSMGNGSNWGVTYNESGSGPLHMGAAMCTFAFNNVNGANTGAGYCAFGDAGGANKIFVAYSGTGDGVTGQGSGPITGGIGKYAGIEGQWSYQCKVVEASQALIVCTQQFDYQLK